MFFSIAFDILVVLFILQRQRRVRPVRRVLRLTLPIFVGVIGVFQLLSYTDSHHVSGTSWLWLLGSLVVGAGVLGALRALSTRLWVSNDWVVRQGTEVTMALWVLSLALHLAVNAAAPHHGSSSLETSSFLLYIAVTLGVQAALVHRRALPLWSSLGPDAGRRVQVNFGAMPGGAGAFFTSFRNDGGAPGRAPAPSRSSSPSNDPTIIDAEVVEDEDPPQLR
jgi:hypothetical protein